MTEPIIPVFADAKVPEPAPAPASPLPPPASAVAADFIGPLPKIKHANRKSFVKGDPRIKRWKKGERPRGKDHQLEKQKLAFKGTRATVSGAFLYDLAFFWRQHGMAVIEKVAKENPAKILDVVVACMPKDDKLEVTHSGAVDAFGLQEISRRTQELLDRAAQRDITGDSITLSDGPVLSPVVRMREDGRLPSVDIEPLPRSTGES